MFTLKKGHKLVRNRMKASSSMSRSKMQLELEEKIKPTDRVLRSPRNSSPTSILNESILINRIRFLVFTLILFAAFFYLSDVFEYSNTPIISSSLTATTTTTATAGKQINNNYNYDQPTVAICITGQLRSFRQSAVRLSIHKHIIQSIQQQGFKTHVFFHLPKSDMKNKKMDSELFLNFQPYQLSFYKRLVREDQCPMYDHLKKCNDIKNNTYTCPYTLIRSDECMQNVHKYEKKRANNFKFSWILKTRPDIALASNITIPNTNLKSQVYLNMHMPHTSNYSYPILKQSFPNYPYPSSAPYNPVGDLIYLIPSTLSSLFFYSSTSSTSVFNDCNLFHLFKDQNLSPEVILTYWLVKNNIHFTNLPWFWMIVRSKEGPVCENVQYIRTRNQTLDNQMLEICQNYKKTGVLTPLS